MGFVANVVHFSASRLGVQYGYEIQGRRVAKDASGSYFHTVAVTINVQELLITICRPLGLNIPLSATPEFLLQDVKGS